MVTTCTGSTLSGTLIRDDSTNDGSNITITSLSAPATSYVDNNVTMSSVQSYTGMTYIEAGTLTSARPTRSRRAAAFSAARRPCWRVAERPTAILALGANNRSRVWPTMRSTRPGTAQRQYADIGADASSSWSSRAQIVDGTRPAAISFRTARGTSILTGTNSYTGATTVNAGTLDVEGTITGSSGITVNSGGMLAGDGTIDPPTARRSIPAASLPPARRARPGRR